MIPTICLHKNRQQSDTNSEKVQYTHMASEAFNMCACDLLCMCAQVSALLMCVSSHTPQQLKWLKWTAMTAKTGMQKNQLSMALICQQYASPVCHPAAIHTHTLL